MRRKLPFAVLLAGAAFLGVSCASRPHPQRVEVRPASGAQVALLVKVGGGLQLHVQAEGFGMNDRRLVELTAPGTLQITGGEGELELSTADTAQRFILIVKRDAAGVTRQLETLGQLAVIRMRGGKMEVEAESMSMREVRAP
jgi:hypothetical protein